MIKFFVYISSTCPSKLKLLRKHTSPLTNILRTCNLLLNHNIHKVIKWINYQMRQFILIISSLLSHLVPLQVFFSLVRQLAKVDQAIGYRNMQFSTHHCCQTRFNVWPSILVEKNIRLDVRNLFIALTKLHKFLTFKVLIMILEQETIRNTRIEQFILQSQPAMPRILLLAYPSYQIHSQPKSTFFF